MAKRNDSLNALLAASFKAAPTVSEPSPEAEAGKTALPLSTSLPGGAGQGSAVPADAPDTKPGADEISPPEDFEGVKKTTVSFYAREQEAVDHILDILRKTRRHRGGFSDAIKIALRLCPLEPEAIAKAWDDARAADKRVLRHRRNG